MMWPPSLSCDWKWPCLTKYMPRHDSSKASAREITWRQLFEIYIGCRSGIVSHINCVYWCTRCTLAAVRRISPVSWRLQPIYSSGSDFDLLTRIAMNRSLPDLSSVNVAFHMPDLKHGMRCRPSFRTYRTTVRSNASWRHFFLNARSLHGCLAAGHIKCVSAEPCGLDWIRTQHIGGLLSYWLLYSTA